MRSLIRVSWERSAAAQVDTDNPSPTFVAPDAAESTLLRAADSVLKALATELVDEPVCIILTDHHGVALRRMGGDHSLLRALDKVNLAPGFGYAEPEVGTNGIGTALEVGASVLVHGSDHYSGGLRAFSCAGALITHPTSGALLGVIDITTASGNCNSLLLSFAKLAARRIQQRVIEMATELDAALLAGYHAACQHSGGPVMAVSKSVFMMNSLTEQHFDAHDQAALLAQARDAIGSFSATTVIADLPSGVTARLAYQPTLVGEALAGGVIQIKQHRSIARESPAGALTGLSGTSAAWRHVSQELLDSFSRSRRVVVQGETGTGKMALLEAAHRHTARSRRLAVVDAADDSTALIAQAEAELDSGADLVVRRAHLLDREQLDGLADLLHATEASSAADDDRWIALTTIEGQDETQAGTHLLHFFPRTIEVPPLRQHLEDLPELVRSLLDRAGAPQLTLSKQAINQLMRLAWPGNVTHLHDILLSIVRTRRSGVVDIGDLPAECLATTRRSLSRMESLERDAIVKALNVFDGDKTAAATSLGTSRATIYRKLRDYGIVMPR
ncbi:Acetoin dehydrogenase operon transcriptional activator AcoR [Nocardioides dokdonensis FR1436]|uniref:Acetoin dehydrogenase operon transcriptional activator AcoR n=1 Tax=Nocardioides dokdonensis FR1436 TaxID=1300347 RepID=A0A1A9GJS3_9ACTN|nr:helix-turn-helix domain-containing protein [Nocardioides dokdonensis]ANH38518.1 Acetoin dehydrogenase operon transcriptional activator AcoR [Nocardioides dokdonensis FR1436]